MLRRRAWLFFAALALVPAACSVPAAELAALSDLYFATGGPTSWIRTAGWSTLEEAGGGPTDPCDDDGAWFGVTCAADGDGGEHVVGLDLSLGQLGDVGNGLDGSLPESIGNLTHVKVRNRAGCRYAAGGRVCVCVCVCACVRGTHIGA